MMSNHRWWRKVPSATATAGCNRYAVQCRKCAFPIGTADQGVSGNRELASAIPAGQPPRPARRGPGGSPGQVSGTRLPGQAGDARAAAAHRPAGERADLQAGRPGGVLLGPDLVDRLRHRGDAAGPGAGGGGAYMVSRDNLGPVFASICGAALLIDYVLTVAVSVSAGTAALASAIEPIGNWRVELSVAFIVLLMWGNLRGIREAGKIFAVPTYLYILSLGGVVVYGIWRVAFGHAGPISYDPASSVGLVGPEGGVVTAVSLFLILHAFSAGTTALTGVEAIADGVPAFKKPEARNAQRTLLVMALIMAFLFLGITFLARQLEVQPYESGNPTLVAQIARYVLGPGIGRTIFLFVQIATLAILVLAANTAFNGFPVLAYFAADDALLPRQLRKRGHRLVYSNGILLLAGAWMVVVAVPLIVLLLSRTRSAYAAELAELKVEASQRLAPPKPRHEVVVLLEDLDRAAIGALQYARQLNPLHITAIHVALDPDHARRLAGLWARINLPVPLEVVDCPDRNL